MSSEQNASHTAKTDRDVVRLASVRGSRLYRLGRVLSTGGLSLIFERPHGDALAQDRRTAGSW
jgi:hypothetical protein